MRGHLNPGDEFAGHRIEQFVGRGGMGMVHLATHLALGRRVALKVVLPEIGRRGVTEEVLDEGGVRLSGNEAAGAMGRPWSLM